MCVMRQRYRLQCFLPIESADVACAPHARGRQRPDRCNSDPAGQHSVPQKGQALVGLPPAQR